jgi:hypothetical protein
MNGLGFSRVAPAYIPPRSRRVGSQPSIWRSTAARSKAVAWAKMSPGGGWRWAASPAQPVVAGPGAHAGAGRRPRAGFHN